MQSSRPAAGKGKPGKKGARRNEPSNPFNPMGNTTKSTAQVIDPEVSKHSMLNFPIIITLTIFTIFSTIKSYLICNLF